MGGSRSRVWLRLVMLFDAAHEVAAAEEVGAELGRDGARYDGELVASHLGEVDGAAGRDQTGAPLKN